MVIFSRIVKVRRGQRVDSQDTNRKIFELNSQLRRVEGQYCSVDASPPGVLRVEIANEMEGEER